MARLSSLGPLVRDGCEGFVMTAGMTFLGVRWLGVEGHARGRRPVARARGPAQAGPFLIL